MERIINKIINENLDIDKILVVTFTNAAASEMRQRILDAIYEKLEENPDNEHLQKQIILISKANICTIHSFCLDVIKNNFYEIDISPNFRIGEQTEIELLKQEVLEELFEENYFEKNEEFLQLIDTYTTYREDEPLKEIILKIYRYIQSNPFPEKWLETAVESFNLKENIEKDFSNTIWGEILLQSVEDEISAIIIEQKSIEKILKKYNELEKFYQTICSDREKMEEIKKNCSLWDETYQNIINFQFDKWPIDRKVSIEQKEIAKQKRDTIKKNFDKLKEKIMIFDSKTANQDIYEMYEILNIIKKIVLKFSTKFSQKKQEKNIIDFNDIEHFALKILLKIDEEGKYGKTEIAKKYQQVFEEIAIDEYQDSNLVQEYILSTISRGNNIFMVGDVKQSIYKFRQARPELFIKKYETYKIKEEQKEKDNLKIQLFKNFRSRQNILDITNLIFESIMSKTLGDIEYNKEEYLNLGSDYKTPKRQMNYAGKTELHIIDLKKKAEEQEEIEIIENVELEAKFVAKKIKDIIKSKYQVYDKKIGYRDITYKDIVILLRSTSILAPIYEKEMNELEIPVFSDTGTQYLDTVEIQTIISILKIIDNPRQDIPLVSALRSCIGGFDDNELIEIKMKTNKVKQTFYETLIQARQKVEKPLRNKINKFLENIEIWREQQEYIPLDELLWKIYNDTGYYNYVSLMPNGDLRQANLKMLFDKAKQYEQASFKGLFDFINFIERIKNNNSDMDSAKIIGENENVVRIMSIHKSKGLEFPVVFLSSTAKKFNMQDLNDNILLHQDLGLGPKCINYKRRIQYNTLAKEAIAYKTKIETISEEMRILYVALTRAKEKLIITGISKDVEEELNKKGELLQMYEEKNINPNIIKKYKSYLDWLELVYLKNKKEISKIMEIFIQESDKIIETSNITKKQSENIIEKIEEKAKKYEKVSEDIQKKLDWTYKNYFASKIEAKTSVSEMKQKQAEQVEEKNRYEIEMLKPKFLKQEEETSKARIGTLMHLCIQKLDESKEYDYEKIQNIINQLIQKELITKKEADEIDIDKILKYTKTKLWEDLKKAKKIYKEQPFYINIPAKEIYNEEIEEKILVQGVIDLYYIDKNGEVILVDYKTDYIKKGKNELIYKYQSQLLLYKRALEEALQTKVSKVYIYSTYLNEVIEVI
ncbi:MAG: helicase-exonuclease AddAB subunit AddA [Clostridia bacterium]|nr:helicase-exonuclease AddAB subunit AddA [Clostridia bacterium]